MPITNQPARFDAGVELWHGDRLLEIVTSRPHQGGFLVRFAGFDDRNAAETLRGRDARGRVPVRRAAG